MKIDKIPLKGTWKFRKKPTHFFIREKDNRLEVVYSDGSLTRVIQQTEKRNGLAITFDGVKPLPKGYIEKELKENEKTKHGNYC